MFVLVYLNFFSINHDQINHDEHFYFLVRSVESFLVYTWCTVKKEKT
jgi:hypothetical protein